MRKQLTLKAAAQAGFTLIELIIVIVIIGILAAVAIPKYQDLQTSANLASAQAQAGNLASASAINYARSKTVSGATAVTSCSGVAGLVSGLTGTVSDLVAGTSCNVVLGGQTATFAIAKD